MLRATRRVCQGVNAVMSRSSSSVKKIPVEKDKGPTHTASHVIQAAKIIWTISFAFVIDL